MRVTARGEHHRSAPVECAAGTLGLSIELAVTGNVAGHVRLDEGLDPALLSLRLGPAGRGEDDDGLQVHGQVHPDGGFQVAGLTPGLWNLQFSDSIGRHPVATIEGIEVPSGSPSTDPRLRDIDLRGRLAVVRLSIDPPRPTDLVMGTLIYRPAGSPPGGEDQSTTFLHDTSVVLCVAGSAADLSVRVNGFRAVELAGVRGDVRVELERGPAVRLKLPPGAELPEPPRFLKPYLSAEQDASSMGGHFQQEIFDERREVLLYAPAPGRLQVHWLIETRAENSLSTMTLTVFEPQFIEVLDLGREQVFEVTLPDFDK